MQVHLQSKTGPLIPSGDDLLRSLREQTEPLQSQWRDRLAHDPAGFAQLEVEIHDPANVIGSRDELASAFGNLLSNAVRYTPEGGRIALDWRVTSTGGEFTVADTGIGIAAEHIPRLTERFYRVDRSRSRATGGTGLGLAIVKHVLIRHQAELVIDSAPAQGSRFSVRLPARRIRAIAESAPSEAAGETTPR